MNMNWKVVELVLAVGLYLLVAALMWLEGWRQAEERPDRRQARVPLLVCLGWPISLAVVLLPWLKGSVIRHATVLTAIVLANIGGCLVTSPSPIGWNLLGFALTGTAAGLCLWPDYREGKWARTETAAIACFIAWVATALLPSWAEVLPGMFGLYMNMTAILLLLGEITLRRWRRWKGGPW